MSSQTIVTIVLGLVEVVSFSIMSRLLTKEDFGYYAAISAITMVFATFSETGIGSAIVQQKDLTKHYVNNAFTISLVFGGFISVLLFLLAGPLSSSVADESMKVPLMLMSGTLLLNSLTSVNNSIMHRKLQFLRMGLINLVSLVITTCVAIWLAYKGFGYYAIIAKAILGSVITYVLSYILCKTRFGFAFDWHTFKKIFSFSGWLMASSLFRNLSHQVDRLMMPRLLSISALGAYNRPKDFIEQISTKFNGIFDTALFPVLSDIQDNRNALNSAFHRSLFLMNVFASLLTLAFVFNSGLLIHIFFGKQWISLQNIMMAISCTLLFNIDGRLADCYLRSLALTKQQFLFRVLEFVIKTLGVFIGSRSGIMGVAISLIITNSIVKTIKIIYVGDKVAVKPKQTIGIILSSWRHTLVILPICVIAFCILPSTVNGCVIMTLVFVVTTVFVFVFMPRFVGKPYEEEVYKKTILNLKSKLIRNKNNKIV